MHMHHGVYEFYKPKGPKVVVHEHSKGVYVIVKSHYEEVIIVITRGRV